MSSGHSIIQISVYAFILKLSKLKQFVKIDLDSIWYGIFSFFAVLRVIEGLYQSVNLKHVQGANTVKLLEFFYLFLTNRDENA